MCLCEPHAHVSVHIISMSSAVIIIPVLVLLFNHLLLISLQLTHTPQIVRGDIWLLHLFILWCIIILLCVLVFYIYLQQFRLFVIWHDDDETFSSFASSGRRFQNLYFTTVNTSIQMDTWRYSVKSKIYLKYILCSIMVPFGALMLYVHILKCVITRWVQLKLQSSCQGT